ncbi:protein involved in capsular polysaccharide export [Bordetella trematum]|uniref:Protein involved in capsular polysaccharide export n=1 Tax=Bordetella trematum TaxID=123899 RepID=A0A157QTP9_9BORD|nr:capsular polysaccharide biosynthesis protein [Bordetella trematum]AUL48316.1 beta-3-deoxy-D-manno-oct-2-ulosonic acid transferase [Bordetella trematum]SAI49243.1 protein involved in capsular polysaccharide export [Bordetella trematum]SAI66933.1 protein involved in capsular polysaccharide export [Bordetella trematum]SUV96367.1 protein involved in capsular polysaccharide export [Bordetella trematum]
MLGTFSRKLSRLPGLATLLGEPVEHLRFAGDIRRKNVRAIIGWGMRSTTRRPRKTADRAGLPFIALEDGFLRSFGSGPGQPTLSLVIDTQGIYYDASRPSLLEEMLASERDLLSGPGADTARARALIQEHRLGKYNAAPDSPPPLASGKRVLIVDQTRNDAGILYGNASAETFQTMLRTARAEHPDATLYIKTHPEVTHGRKRGYFQHLQADERTILIREAVSAHSLLEHMDHVYVVTSQLGFEALLQGKPVTCFGSPWYAGWGVTDDRQPLSRRQRQRNVDELFAAAYLHYTRYLNPYTHQKGNIFDVIHWLAHQRDMQRQQTGRSIAIGIRHWKARLLTPFLGRDTSRTYFVANAAAAAALRPTAADRLCVWSSPAHVDVEMLAHDSKARLVHMEDGFVRSVGLGSDFVAPQSLVLDEVGIYFDASRPSGLETLLNTHRFSQEECERAQFVRELITRNQVTKYNIEPNDAPSWAPDKRTVVLVPGQVEDDASIRLGCGPELHDNLALLQAVREARPDAFIVYKPHPEVLVRNRRGRLHGREALRYADHIETQISIVSCVAASDEIHTMTSLTGFEGLLRGKHVVTYGLPFYAGWGLTEDKIAAQRRTRTLTLDELVAGTLLLYPTYWDWTLGGFTSCEAALDQIIRQRDRLLAENRLSRVQKSYLERLFLKASLWVRGEFMVRR